MSNWGLLGGIGRGLNQFGDTMQKGMSADITAKKQEEAEARRQASIEKRWAKQDAQQAKRDEIADQRYTDTVARQDKNDAAQAEQRKTQNAQAERRLQQDEDAKALSIYQSYEKEENKQISKIETETIKQIREAQALGQTEEALRIKEQADTRIEQIQKQYEKAKDPYRNKLIKSGYLTDALPEPTPDNEGNNKPPPTIDDNPNPRDALFQKVIAGNENTTAEPSDYVTTKPFNDTVPLPINADGSLQITGYGGLIDSYRVQDNLDKMQALRAKNHAKANKHNTTSAADTLYRRY